MFTTAQDALHWFKAHGYPTSSQVVFTEPPLSEGMQKNIQEWARLAEISPPQGLAMHIYWVRLTDTAEQSGNAHALLNGLVQQFARRYPQYHALFVARYRSKVKLMCAAYTPDGQLRVAGAPLSEDNQRLLETLHYNPNTPTEKHWQRIQRAITGDEAMHTRINQAFENFLAELKEILAEAQEMIVRKTREGYFDEIEKLSRQAKQVQQLIEATEMLRNRWDTPQTIIISPPSKSAPRNKRTNRASSNEITTQRKYTRPLLQALVNLGGTARTSEVIDEVGRLMEHRLKPADHETLPSGKEKRWRNAVQWTRNDLKEMGYIKSGSRKGIWEITDAGRAYLQQLQAEDTNEPD